MHSLFSSDCFVTPQPTSQQYSICLQSSLLTISPSREINKRQRQRKNIYSRSTGLRRSHSQIQLNAVQFSFISITHFSPQTFPQSSLWKSLSRSQVRMLEAKWQEAETLSEKGASTVYSNHNVKCMKLWWNREAHHTKERASDDRWKACQRYNGLEIVCKY